MTKKHALARLLAAATLTTLVAGCNNGISNSVYFKAGADDVVEAYDVYVWDEPTQKQVLHTGWTSNSGTKKDFLHTPLLIQLKFAKAGKYGVLIVGAGHGPMQMPADPLFTDMTGGPPVPAANQFFFAKHLNIQSNNDDIAIKLLKVPTGDDMDHDLWPDATAWSMHNAAASTYSATPELLDCADKMVLRADGKPTAITPAAVHPYATVHCMDDVDENCSGMVSPCVDSDNDGDPDDTDCDKNNPKVHHPITDPNNPHYDPYPESANCCGYSFGLAGMSGQMVEGSCADTTMAPCMAGALCHPGTCGNGIDEDCSANGDPKGDIRCANDNDCDDFNAKDNMSSTGKACTAPKQADGTGTDCNDCDPAINPSAVEICDGIDNNCNGLTDETCVPCDLDGDGFQRMDTKYNCPDATYKASGRPVDCNDEDSGVYPGSTMKAIAIGTHATCNGKEGGNPACALRGACRNKNPDTTAQDADCDGMVDGCPPPQCDQDGDGFVPANLQMMAACSAFKGTPVDCNDSDPTVYLGAPDHCGDGVMQNCVSDIPCATDMDKDGYDATADCNDGDPAIHPWATEICDGKDNDCDGLTDEGNPGLDGKPLVDLIKKSVIKCNDSNTGVCGTAPPGDCICSSTGTSNLFFTQGARIACPGETADIDTGTLKAATAPRCFFAYQPQSQSCEWMMPPRDDDCDGRNDAPDGKNLAIAGMPCWPKAVGQCAPAMGGKITGCKIASAGQGSNCIASYFLKNNPTQPPPVSPWYQCDDKTTPNTCPVDELCNGFDDNCDGMLPLIEQDVDKDTYIQCGSTDAAYAMGGACQTTLAMGIAGCGDCHDHDAGGKFMSLDDAKIHPGMPDICNSIDDDCNTMTPDGSGDCPGTVPGTMLCCAPAMGVASCKNTQNDVQNCNTCGNVCVLANATPICVATVCKPGKCMLPNDDCDKNPANGCEVNLDVDANNCGKCGTMCSNNNIATPTCAGQLEKMPPVPSVCNGACNPNFADCNSDKLTDGCEINLQTDAGNCGKCTTVCSNNNIPMPTCGGGVCNGTCAMGFDDCDKNKQNNGCEINLMMDPSNCAKCAQKCSGNNINMTTCVAGVCSGACNTGFADCNMNKLIDGCEINLNTDPKNCSMCGTACSNNNITTTHCTGGMCDGACDAGWTDCDMNKLTNGCETNTSGASGGDPNNCGGCNMVCSSNNILANDRTCKGGICKGNCVSGYADCNMNKLTDGCEIHTDADPLNCGMCNVKCSTNNITPACSVVAMTPTCTGMCNANWADCDMNKLTNGCEQDIAGNVNNCGGCGQKCSNNHVPTPSCAAQMCNGACAAGWADCDMNKLTNGCEQDIAGSAANCGGCNMACSNNNIATPTCGNGMCNGMCNAGFADCNGNKLTDGCEVNTQMGDANNCGGCTPNGMTTFKCSNNNITTPTCGGGKCNASCNTGFLDCDMNKLTNGCEINGTNDASNCGMCGTKCASDPKGKACVSSSCGCNAATDCPAGTADGCSSPSCTCNGGAACNGTTRQCKTGAGCLLVVGQMCTAGTDCVSGNCVQGQTAKYCSSKASCPSCQVINPANDMCINALAGTDPKTPPDCPTNTMGACQAGGCTSGACTPASNTTVCGTMCTHSMMVGSQYTNAAVFTQTCTGSALTCPSSVKTKDCAPYDCANATMCGVTCSSDGDCLVGSACDMTSHNCKAGLGKTCNPTNNGSDCASGHCTDSVCCNAGCGGTCQTCLMAKSQTGAADGMCSTAKAGTAPRTGCTGYFCDGTATTTCPGTCSMMSNCTSGYCCSSTSNLCALNTLDASCGASCLNCPTSNSGHKCISGACSCTAAGDCPNGTAPFCVNGTPKQCGCGTAGNVCASGYVCTALDGTGMCKKDSSQMCTMNPECASGTCDTVTTMMCTGVASGKPCSAGSQCTSTTCKADGTCM